MATIEDAAIALRQRKDPGVRGERPERAEVRALAGQVLREMGRFEKALSAAVDAGFVEEKVLTAVGQAIDLFACGVDPLWGVRAKPKREEAG